MLKGEQSVSNLEIRLQSASFLMHVDAVANPVHTFNFSCSILVSQ